MGKAGNIRWQLIGWLFLLSAVSYLDRVNISIAGRQLSQAYSLSNVELGWILSAFALGYAIFQAPAGRLADRIGPRRTLALAAVWWAVFSTLSAMVPGGPAALTLLLIVRFTLGAGEAAVYLSLIHI